MFLGHPPVLPQKALGLLEQVGCQGSALSGRPLHQRITLPPSSLFSPIPPIDGLSVLYSGSAESFFPQMYPNNFRQVGAQNGLEGLCSGPCCAHPKHHPGFPMQVLCQEGRLSTFTLQCLLQLRAICTVPPGERGAGHYSIYFVVPKKDGSFCPIFDFKCVNRCLCVLRFCMEMLRPVIQENVSPLWILPKHTLIFQYIENTNNICVLWFSAGIINFGPCSLAFPQPSGHSPK